MYMCMYMDVHMYLYPDLYMYVYVYVYMHMYMYMYTDMYTYMYTYMRVYVYVYLYLCMCMCISICMHAYTHTYIYICNMILSLFLKSFGTQGQAGFISSTVFLYFKPAGRYYLLAWSLKICLQIPLRLVADASHSHNWLDTKSRSGRPEHLRSLHAALQAKRVYVTLVVFNLLSRSQILSLRVQVPNYKVSAKNHNYVS